MSAQLTTATKFTIKEFAGFQIKQREDGYLNATEMCKVGDKRFAKYNENNQTKEFLEALADDAKIDVNKLTQSIMTGPNENRCTWVHPRVAIHLAQWVSAKFAVKVSAWIVEWYKLSAENYNKFLHEISNLEPSESNQLEKKIQDELAEKYDAEVEVKTEVGFIDLVTNDYVIEIKDAAKWKHALGQILCYAEFYPNHKKKIILFGEVNFDIDLAKNICSKFDVDVEIYE
jgi:hypothetical protein